MIRISRTSRMKVERIQSLYVNRMTEVGSIERIHRVQRMENTKNQTDRPSENHLLAYEHYYQTEQAGKQAVNRLYKHEQQLVSVIKELHDSSNDILPQMKKVVQKWNETLTSVNDVDQLAGTNHKLRIHHYFLQNAELFKKIGLTLTDNNSVSFDTDTFVASNPRKLVLDIISQLKAIIKHDDQAFYKRKKPNHLRSYEQPPLELKGLIIEEEG
ncbi:hypothetical protein ACFFHM_01885 [Halalkalibacter kiskunsagensis]|uniref:Transposase n=1 Tax=Halalkalibacter kiskunsagensis TaxID=1548599 RepID=A0ABV6K7M9_9BACI